MTHSRRMTEICCIFTVESLSIIQHIELFIKLHEKIMNRKQKKNNQQTTSGSYKVTKFSSRIVFCVFLLTFHVDDLFYIHSKAHILASRQADRQTRRPNEWKRKGERQDKVNVCIVCGVFRLPSGGSQLIFHWFDDILFYTIQNKSQQNSHPFRMCTSGFRCWKSWMKEISILNERRAFSMNGSELH